MEYTINPQYYFCGWDGLPFAITSDKARRPEFMTKDQFQLLWSCDGRTNISRDTLDGDTAKFFNYMLEKNIVLGELKDTPLRLHRYKRYPCRFRANVQLSITGECNYKCKHCFQSAPHGLLGQPSTEQVCAELDQVAECGVRQVSITGGEPLIHEGFLDIIDHIKKLNLQLTTIYTNGKLVNQNLLDEFKKRGLHPSWSISFDGLGQHDWIRGVKGAQDAAIAAIKLLVANDYPVGCAYALTKRTAPVFRETVNFLASIGVHSIKSGYTQAQGEWLNHAEEWLTDEEYLEFYKEYIPQYLADGRPLNLQFEGLFFGTSDRTLAMKHAEREKITVAEDLRGKNIEAGIPEINKVDEEDKPYGFMTERNINEEQYEKFLSCGVLGTSFYIGPTGKVLPCMSMDGTAIARDFDTLWDKPLREILSKGSRFIEATGYTMKDVFDHNKHDCKECEARTRCGSGCRASALGANDTDYLSCDLRTCKVCKEDWATQIRESIAAAGLEQE